MTRIPVIPTEYIEAIGVVVLFIIIAVISAGFINVWQEQSEAEQLRENAEDIIDFINRRDSCYGE